MAERPKVFSESIEYLLDHARDILDGIEPAVLEAFLKALDNAPRIFVYGAGRSGLVAKAFAIRLAHLGYPTFVVGETITAPVHAKDLVVLVSGSGDTMPVKMTADIAKDLGAKVVLLTAKRDSATRRHADLVVELRARSAGKDEHARLAPLGTHFEAAAWLFLDGVVADLMHRRGQTEARMRQRHATLE